MTWLLINLLLYTDKFIIVINKHFLSLKFTKYLFFSSVLCAFIFSFQPVYADYIQKLSEDGTKNIQKHSVFFSLAEHPIKLAHYFSSKTNNLVIDISQTDQPSSTKAITSTLSSNLLIDLYNHNWHNTGIEYSLNFNNTKIPIKSGVLRQKSSKCLRIICDLENNIDYNVFLTASTTMLPQYLVIETIKKFSQELAKHEDNYNLRDIIIVVDPGHGGADPGCINYKSNILEKDITFSIANKLVNLLNKHHGFKAILTRNNDTYIKLQERVQIAQNNRADLFISIHADGSKNLKACGFSVFVISPESAQIEQKKTNNDINFKIDLFGISDWLDIDKYNLQKNNNSKFSLLQSSSYEIANKILDNLSKLGKLHQKQVYNASFAVLKSLRIPSVLVESGFLTNIDEATKLAEDQHQHIIAQEISSAILAWFNVNPPKDTLAYNNKNYNLNRKNIKI